jgi:2'-5' RNA ligase
MILLKKDRYTPAEAKRAYDQLDRLVADKSLTARQAGAHRRHIANRIRVALKEAYSEQAARRAKAEIVRLAEAGTISPNSARAYRAHITKRTTGM